MYLPQHFEVSDPQRLHALMRDYSFATLVSVHEGQPFATHMPFVVEADGSLSSHVARANPQWQSLEGQEVLVIFQGPHSFISPTWYEKHPSVPTWNYLSVHAYGKAKLVHQPDKVQALLHKLVLQYEQQWDMQALPESYMQGMMKGLVAFEIEVSRLEGKFKLSQNRSPADRQRVIEALSQSPHPDDQAIAQHMQQALDAKPSL